MEPILPPTVVFPRLSPVHGPLDPIAERQKRRVRRSQAIGPRQAEALQAANIPLEPLPPAAEVPGNPLPPDQFAEAAPVTRRRRRRKQPDQSILPESTSNSVHVTNQ